jgi:hypothetical protein
MVVELSSRDGRWKSQVGSQIAAPGAGAVHRITPTLSEVSQGDSARPR